MDESRDASSAPSRESACQGVCQGSCQPEGQEDLPGPSRRGVKRKAGLAWCPAASPALQSSTQNSQESGPWDSRTGASTVLDGSRPLVRPGNSYQAIWPGIPAGFPTLPLRGSPGFPSQQEGRGSEAQQAPRLALPTSSSSKKASSLPRKRQKTGLHGQVDTAPDQAAVSPSDLHQACWDGDLHKLTHNFRLGYGSYVKTSKTIVKDLLTVGKVVQTFQVEGEFQRRSLTGTPAELAVRAGHLHCANLILATILLRWSRASPFEPVFQIKQSTTIETFLRDLLFCLNDQFRYWRMKWIETFQHEQDNGLEAFYCLVAACLLGQSEVVKTLLESVSPSFWKKLEDFSKDWSRERLEFPSTEVVMNAAGQGGNRRCLEIVTQVFDGFMTSNHLEKAVIGIPDFLWPWKCSQMKSCLHVILGHPKFQGTQQRLCRKFVKLIDTAKKWISSMSKCEETFGQVGIPLPSAEAILNDLQTVIPLMQGAVSAKSRVSTVVSHDIIQLMIRLREEGESGMRKLQEFCLLILLSQRESPCPLARCGGGSNLAKCTKAEQEDFLEMVCQFMVLNKKRRVFQDSSPSCDLCHPLVNFVCGVQTWERSILSEDNLWRVGVYFRQSELTSAIDILEKGRRLKSLCPAHRDEIRQSCFALYGKVKKEESQVVETLEEVRKGIHSLQQLCKMTVLENLQGNASNLDKLPVPGGLKKLFNLSHFFEDPPPDSP